MMYGGHGSIDPTGFNPSMQSAQAGGYGEVALGETRAWFDHFLKGVANGVESRPPLSVLVPRGADWNSSLGFEWLGLEDWPDPATSWQTLNLDGSPDEGPGVLTAEAPVAPTPDSALGGAGWGLTGNADVDSVQQLVYQSHALEADLTVVGPVTLHLFASIASVDAAWNVQLQEVLADGSVRQVQDGQLQASHRALDEQATRSSGKGEIVQPVHPHDALEPTQPGTFYDFAIEIPTVFNTFMEGSRLRLVIAANDARPALDGHATAPTGVSFSVAHDALRPSRILLPVLERPAERSLLVPYTQEAR
jgi:putative CocE/NonD family hydrolase